MSYAETSPYRRTIGNLQFGRFTLYGFRIVRNYVTTLYIILSTYT